MIPQKPIILLQNNTDATLVASLFTNNPSRNGLNNGNPTYAWDISGQNLAGLKTVQLQVKTSGLSSFVTLTASVITADVAGVLGALNSLGAGFFFVSPLAPGVITTANSVFIYGNLTTGQSPSQATLITTGGLQINNAGVLVSGTLALNDVTTGFGLVMNTATPITPPEFIPFVFNMDFPFSQLNDGDTLRAQVTALNGAPVTTMIIKQDGVVILNQTLPGNTPNFFFTYSLNSTYDFNAVVN